MPVIAVDPVRKAAAACPRFGADWALDPSEEDFAQQVRALTGGGAKVAIEVTGVGQALNQVLTVWPLWGGLLCWAAPVIQTLQWTTITRSMDRASLIGAHTLARPQRDSSPGMWTDRYDIAALLRLLQNGRLCWKELVERRCSLP